MKVMYKRKNNVFQSDFGYGNSLDGTVKLGIELIYGCQCVSLLSELLSFYACLIAKKRICCSKSL